MIKRRRKRKSNQGNSFIVVVATISFLSVLVTALLVAVALCFRLKAYDINSRDNFYYLEQAMDEIYEGVGSITMKHLNTAYNETAEVLVYFDPGKQSYVTMDNSDANKLMKSTFINKIKNEDSFKDANIINTLNGFISYSYDASDRPEGVQLLGADVAWDGDTLVIKNIILKREAEYSTVNTVKGQNKAVPTTFVQSITTDLVIAEPDFEVNFSPVGNDISELYDFVLISDMGVEINGIGTRSHITGNVYAAADFYNKEYNQAVSNGTVQEETEETIKKPLENKVNSYSEEELKKCDGVSEKSMYSGFYVSGAKVSIMADKLIVPGSIAAMNCGNLSVVGSAEEDNSTGKTNGASKAKVWADGIILGGYSRKTGASSSGFTGSVLKMKADAYIYDDLEVNATGSEFSLDGTYYGYNYASTDNRKYSDEFIAASTNRKFLKDVRINDGNYIGDDGTGGHLTGQAHYNSSAVIVNGADATLDLSNVSTMYIAGQAYVELSKSAESKTYEAKEENDNLTLEEVTDATNEDDKVTVDTYAYEGQSDENYTTTNTKKDDAATRIQDYRTGEGLSVKSNQLAYIPPYDVLEDEEGNIFVQWPELLTHTDYFKDMWANLQKVPVIKTMVSGKPYYFYDFSQAQDGITMNQYLEEYAKLFELKEGEIRSTGELASLYDITDFQAFKVENVEFIEGGLDNLSDDEFKKKMEEISGKIYSNSAISVIRDGKITIKADSKSVQPLLEAKKVLDSSLQPSTDVNASSTDAEVTGYAKNITTGLQKEYKEMKMLLTSTSTNGEAVTYAYGAEESEITPINYYFNFEGLNDITETSNRGNLSWKNNLKSGYQVFLGEGNVEVKADNGSGGNVKGIVICKGDVTFDSSVKEFEGIIVAGGKILVNHSINFVANPEVVKSVLRECDESRNTAGTGDLSGICNLFRHFVSNYESTQENNNDIVSMKNITAVQYEDMVAFENWKKNVD